MFYFESNFGEKILWESSFSHFGHVTILEKWNFVFWPPFWNGTFHEYSLCWFMVALGVYRYGAIFDTGILMVKYLTMVGSKWTPPPVHKREWKVA